MALTEEEIVQQVLAARNESKESKIRKDAWARRGWSWYNNEADESLKEDWQTKIRLPKFAMAIDQATSLMKTSLRQSSRLFGIEVESDDPVDKALAAFFSEIMHELLRKIDFVSTLADGMKVSLVTNMGIHKVGWTKEDRTELAPVMRTEEQEIFDDEGRLIEVKTDAQFDTEEIINTISLPSVRVVNPRDFYPDPRGLDLYDVQDARLDLFKVLEMGRGVFRPEALAALEKEDFSDNTNDESEVDRTTQAQIITPSNAWRKITKLTEYWGPLVDRDGQLLRGNRLITIGNDKHLLREVLNPLWDGTSPYVRYNAIQVPFSVWGKLLVQHVDSLQTYMNELVNLIFDGLKISTLNPLEVDMNLLDDVEDILTGLFPGKMFKVRGPNAIRELRLSGPENSAFSMFGLLGQETQNSHGVTEFLAGLPTVRGRPTATEINTKTSQSAGFFDGITMDIENRGVGPTVEKFYNRIMQFMDDWSDPAIQKIARKYGLQDMIRNLDPIQRHTLMKRPFRFRVVGLNAAIRRAETLEKMLRFLEIIGTREELARRVPIEKIFEKTVQLFDMEELVSQSTLSPNVMAPGNIPREFENGLPQELLSGLQNQLVNR